MMRVYEKNYLRLCQMIPELCEIVGRKKLSVTHFPELYLDVLERCKYTTTIALTHYLKIEGELVPDLYMKIRVYHDAKVAEVISYQNQSRFVPIYSYPNPKMRQPHEKRQINLFLGEWLTYCGFHGYSPAVLPNFSNA